MSYNDRSKYTVTKFKVIICKTNVNLTCSGIYKKIKSSNEFSKKKFNFVDKRNSFLLVVYNNINIIGNSQKNKNTKSYCVLIAGLQSRSRSRSRTFKRIRSRSRSRNILSDYDSSCPISLHISDANRATYAPVCASGVQCSNLFKRTLPRIARHSVQLIKSLHFNL